MSLSGPTRRGQSLVEVILAVGVIAVVATGLVRVVVNSIASGAYARSQAQATKYANEGLEWARQERDRGWDAFYTRITTRNGSGYCMANLDWSGAVPADASSTPCGANLISGTEFTRWGMVNVVNAGSEVSVTVKVRWVDSKGSHTAQAGGSLTNWRVK